MSVPNLEPYRLAKGMTDRELRIAIAKAMGYGVTLGFLHNGHVRLLQVGTLRNSLEELSDDDLDGHVAHGDTKVVPDFPSDVEAMFVAEDWAAENSHGVFCNDYPRNLAIAVLDGKDLDSVNPLVEVDSYDFIHASPRKRAEAFVMTIPHWSS